jgi:hypothetical protein
MWHTHGFIVVGTSAAVTKPQGDASRRRRPPRHPAFVGSRANGVRQRMRIGDPAVGEPRRPPVVSRSVPRCFVGSGKRGPHGLLKLRDRERLR